MKREQFTFYRSYYEALKKLSKRDREQAIMAICAYALDEETIPLTGGASVVFLLVKPTLDSARKRAAGGQHGKSAASREDTGKPAARCREDTGKPAARYGEDTDKPAARCKEDTGKEKEVETEIEIEVEIEVEDECHPPAPDDIAAVLTDYRSRVNPRASPAALAELEGFARSCGAEVCRRAMDTAVDNGRPTWPYIRAILRDKQARGIQSLAQWDAWEERRQHGGHDSIHRETAQEKYHGVGTEL